MVLRRMTPTFKFAYNRGCKYKNKYNIFQAIYRCVYVRLINKEHVHIYKCYFGNHYHIGHTNKKTKSRINYLNNYTYKKLTLAFLK